MKIDDIFRMPEIKKIKDLDDPSTSDVHRGIIKKKYFLKRVYVDFYEEFKKLIFDDIIDGTVVELGSGGGFIKEIMPGVITSDVNISVPLDIKFSVDNIPFKDGSVSVFLLLNVFHHFSDPLACITEMNRCLKDGGRIIMIEPANTFFKRLVDNNFHYESFGFKGGWHAQRGGPLTCSNQALPWIIFSRDRALFEKKFPGLKIKNITLHNNFRYVISGGLTYRQLLPSCMYGAVRMFEKSVSGLRNYLGYFQTIELKKTGG